MLQIGEVYAKYQVKFSAFSPATTADLRDPACVFFSYRFLNYERLSHLPGLARHSQALEPPSPPRPRLGSCISDVLAIDIHPVAEIGKGILLDHATKFVIGEAAVIGNNVSISVDRHPDISDVVLIGAGAPILGNVGLGKENDWGGSSGSDRWAPEDYGRGHPTRLLGGKEKRSKIEDNPWESMDRTCFIFEWIDDLKI